MIQVFTLAKPDHKLTNFKKEIFGLAKGVYNLPTCNHPNQLLFDQLYTLGVRQIIHDGTTDEIECLDGYLYATSLGAGKTIDEKDILRLKP